MVTPNTRLMATATSATRPVSSRAAWTSGSWKVSITLPRPSSKVRYASSPVGQATRKKT